MQPEMNKEKKVYKTGTILIWVLSVAALVLFISIFYQHIKIKDIQGNETSDVIISQEKTADIGESPAEKQESEYEETIKQLQAELKDLQATGNIDHVKGDISKPDTQDNTTTIYSTDQMRSQTDTFYSPLFKRLGLSQKEAEDFRNLLIERNIAYDDKANEIREKRWTEGNMNIEDGSKQLEDVKLEQDEIIKNFLGEEKYQRYIQYNNSKGVFDIYDKDAIDSLEQSLGTEEQLSEQQRDNLEASMAEVFQEFVANYAPELQGPPPYKMEYVSETTTNSMAEHMDDLQEKYLDRAASILTESQMKDFEYIIRSKMDRSKYALNKRTLEQSNYKDRY